MSDAKGITRARATRDEVDERIEHIEGLMRRARWERGRTNRALAKEWGCSVAAVDDYAAEAGRRVRAELTDKTQVTETVTAALSAVIRGGLEEGDRKAVVSAADVWTRIVGARAPERHEHAVVVAQYEALSPTERARWCREKAAALLAEADRLEVGSEP